MERHGFFLIMNSSLTTQIGNGDNSLAGDFEIDSYGVGPFGVENMDNGYDNTNGYDSYESDGRYDDRQQEYDSQSGSDDGEYGGGKYNKIIYNFAILCK